MNALRSGAIALVVSATALTLRASSPRPDAEVAVMRDRAVLYRQIRCSPGNRVDPPRCLAIEQDNLRRRLYGHALDAAAAHLGITLSPEELAAIEAEVRRQQPRNLAAASQMRAKLRAVLRIHRGENAAAVYEEMRTRGVTDAELSELAARFPTAADAEEALAIDFDGTVERSTRDFYRRARLTPLLIDAIARRAAARGTTTAAVEEELWREVTGAMALRIVDDRYQTPDFNNVLKRGEEQIHVTP